jgi:hypothetical protein
VRWLLVATAVFATLLGVPVSTSLAADPTPTSPVLIDPLDPRTGDEASGVGAPLLALLVVIGSGALVAAITFAYVRITGGRARSP